MHTCLITRFGNRYLGGVRDAGNSLREKNTFVDPDGYLECLILRLRAISRSGIGTIVRVAGTPLKFIAWSFTADQRDVEKFDSVVAEYNVRVRYRCYYASCVDRWSEIND
jgi:hypothetical protein